MLLKQVNKYMKRAGPIVQTGSLGVDWMSPLPQLGLRPLRGTPYRSVIGDGAPIANDAAWHWWKGRSWTPNYTSTRKLVPSLSKLTLRSAGRSRAAGPRRTGRAPGTTATAAHGAGLLGTAHTEMRSVLKRAVLVVTRPRRH